MESSQVCSGVLATSTLETIFLSLDFSFGCRDKAPVGFLLCYCVCVLFFNWANSDSLIAGKGLGLC